MLRRAVKSIRNAASRLRKSENGNVAMMFAGAAIPLVLAAGGVVDFSRVYFAHTDMQDALDATALMLSKNAPTMTVPQMKQSAQDFFYANYRDMDVNNLNLAPTYSAVGPSLTVQGSAIVPMYFMGIIGLTQIPVAASSTVVWGETRLRVALVLDNTGSMSSYGKMSALKTATHNLLDQLQNAAQQNGDVYVSLVPFSRDVNVGTDKVGESWLRWDLWEAVNGTCSSSSYNNKSSCESHGRTWTAASHSMWNGCVTDRDQSYDTRNTAPSSGVQATLFPTDQYSNCPASLMGLTYDWTALDNRVDAMNPSGLTNQSIGLQWGWQSLTEAPFAVPPQDAGYDYNTVVILLTDGLNTEDRWYSNAPSIDARQKMLCDNVKAAGISIYTVQVNTGSDPTSALLQDCASDPSQFFLLTSADQIVTTFHAIGTKLAKLRVSS